MKLTQRYRGGLTSLFTQPDSSEATTPDRRYISVVDIV
jgi:hypothetical protein